MFYGSIYHYAIDRTCYHYDQPRAGPGCLCACTCPDTIKLLRVLERHSGPVDL